MKLNSVPALVAAIVISVLSVACPKSKINPNDSTPPQVQIKVKKNNQYEPATVADLSTSLDLACVVSDPDGVRSIEFKFLGTPASSCTVNGQLTNGSFPVPLPATQQQTLQGDASGNVIESLPVFVTLTAPTCTIGGGATGRPIGHVITAQCKGQNWSSNSQNNSAMAELKATVK